MRDFRSRVVQKQPTVAEVEALLQEGQLTRALRQARATGLRVSQQHIDAAAAKMFRSGRVGELLSLLGSPAVQLPFDAPTLLRRAFEAHDYHGFLKQAHRLGLREGLEGEIRQAIAAIQARAPREAAAWRQKFPPEQLGEEP